jgi:hypothetical protein
MGLSFASSIPIYEPQLLMQDALYTLETATPERNSRELVKV